jgi:biopolymer transport protein ExbB/TolQ
VRQDATEGNVAERRERNLFVTIAGSLGWPLFWGMAAWIAFYLLIHQGWIRNEVLVRYVADHEIEYIETALFFIGMAALTIKLLAVLAQYMTLGRIQLPESEPGGQPVEDCPALRDSLDELAGGLRNSYLVRRLSKALDFVRLSGSAEHLDEELQNLADDDRTRQHEDYALTRIIIWAIPMLGFLGTVIGITAALGQLSKESLINSPDVAMDGLLSGLGVAFNTTTLALSLSIVLMFLQFLIHRIETELLKTVDSRVEAELVGRFQQLGTSRDPHVATLERMSARVIAASERLVAQQVKLWEATIDEAHQRWSRLAGDTGRQLEDSLAGALEKTVKTHTAELVKAENAASERSHRYGEQLKAALVQSAQVMKEQQAELVRQGEVMARVMDATGQVAGLQDTLNQNLHTLAGAKNFEDTVMSLSAAIHLLNTRLGDGPATPAVELAPPSPQVQEKVA